MRLTAFIVGLFAAIALFVVASPSAHAAEKPTQPQRKVVVVQQGDSLSKIARKHKTTYTRLFYANKTIDDPNLIYPGDKVQIPKKGEKLKKRPLPQAAAAQPTVQTKPVQAPQSAPTSSYQPAAPTASAPQVASGSVWDRLASCESGGNWSINTGNGYYGGLQFSAATWRSVGGTGYPHQHSRAEQIKRGKILQARSGWGQWPACSAKLGLR